MRVVCVSCGDAAETPAEATVTATVAPLERSGSEEKSPRMSSDSGNTSEATDAPPEVELVAPEVADAATQTTPTPTAQVSTKGLVASCA